MTEKGFEQSVENFADWTWQFELIIGAIIVVILFVAGNMLLKKKKTNAGYICLGISVLVFISDVFKALLRFF
jgi:low affinity Fe/Cu permease